MATVTTNTIGAAGDYASIQAWQDAAPADLVANDEIWRGEIIDDTHDEAGVTISGSNTDLTRYKHLTVADANKHNGTAGSGKRILPSTSGHIFTVQDDFKCSWLELTDWGTAGSISDEGFRINGAINLMLEGLIAHDALAGAQHDLVYWGDPGGILRAWNCAAWDLARAMFWANGLTSPTGAMYVRNCVGYNLGGSWGPTESTPVIGTDDSGSPDDYSGFTLDIRNTYAHLDSGADANFQCFGAFGSTAPTISAGSGNNASSDDSASIVSGNGTQIENLAASGEFVSLTDGSEDLHLAAGSSLEDAGQDVSGITVPVTADIDGDSRPQGSAYDVGFDEVVSGGNVPDQPTAQTPLWIAGTNARLHSSAYSETDGDAHQSSDWQVDVSGGDFSSPVYEAVDSADLEEHTIPQGTLSRETAYEYRVRHTDTDGDSTWSAAQAFTTTGAAVSGFGGRGGV